MPGRRATIAGCAIALAFVFASAAGAGAPVFDPIGSKTVNEGQLLQFTVSATDPDSDPLTYSAVLLPSGANFNPTTRTFSWTPIKKQAGTYANVAFSASDGISVDTEDITITVNKCRGKGKACP